MVRQMEPGMNQGGTGAAGTSAGPEIHPQPKPWHWVGVSTVIFAVAWIIYQLLTDPGFQWRVVGQYMLDPEVLSGLLTTIELTVIVMVAGTVLGIIVALMRLSGSSVLALVAHAYVWFFRGTPVLVQLVFWYNLASLFPRLSLGIPFGGPKFLSVSSTVAISSFTAALLGLGLNEGAYMAEIVRAGILSVDTGQSEASRALGHRPFQTFRVVVLPQAMKAIVPPTGNQVIGMLKYTSLASVVALPELMNSVENIYSRTFQTIPLLIVAALWYLIAVTLLSTAQYFIETYYSKGSVLLSKI
jgi:polar amino acid transport system permease protein